jgi:AraC-like DNA-binding protein
MTPLFSSYRIHSYGPNEEMGMHAHDDFSFSLIMAGQYEETIRGRQDTFFPGSLLVCPPGEPHAQRFGPKGLYKLVLLPTCNGVERFDALTPLRKAPVLRTSEVMDIARRLHRDLRRDDPFSSLIIEGLSYELTGIFARGHSGSGGVWPGYLRRALAYLAESERSVPRLTEVASAVDCDPDKLSGAFRTYLGCSLGEYHRRCRIEKAAQMLVESRLPLSEIALTCGFSDQPHFNRTFKAQLGLTPAAYRREKS